MSSLRIKRCAVCSDEASGFNFSQLTCGSCRLFFHRNFTKHKELNCRRDNACVITATNRKSCSKCRLEKCLSIGMRKKAPKVSNSSDDASSTTSSDVPTTNSSSFSSNDSFHLTPQSTELRRTLTEDIEDTLEQSIRNEATVAQISANYHLNRPFFVAWRQAASSLELNLHEKRHIDSLNNAFDIFANENDATIIKVSDDVVSSFNTPAIYATKIVKFCKQFPDFKSLNQDIQLQVLKFFYPEMMTIRVAFNYDHEKKGYPLIEDETGNRVLFVKSASLEVMKRKDLVMQNRQMLYDLKIEFENDTLMRNITTALLLFKPRDCLPCNEAMRYKYFQYCNLLRRYLESKYKDVELASHKFSSLINVTDKLEVVRQNYATLLQEFSGHQVVQVLAELFNLSIN